ncbi:unnamed protein product, partial [Effrenium voratum]
NVAEPAEPAEPGSASDQATVVLTINMPFVKELLGMQDTWQLPLGNLTLSDHLELLDEQPEARYHESKLAKSLGLCLRLIGSMGSFPVYSMPRAVRWAAFCGMDLWAFASTEQIVAFRQSMPPLHPKDIKQATNLLAYGNGLVEWMKTHGIVTLPGPLADLKRVMTCVREHVWHRMPEGWKRELKATRRRPILAALSVECQRRERQKLDAAAELLPAGCVVHGYLGDSFLFSSSDGGFSAEATVRHLQSRGLFFTVKPMPANDSEYCRDEEKGPTPHLGLAISVEHRVPVRWDHQQDHMEIYNATDGVWSTGKCDGACKGEMLARALIATYGARTWRPDPDSGKWRLQVRDNVMLFHTAPILSSVGAMLSKLDNGDCMPPLDQERHRHFQIHFKGGDKLSFLAHPPPLQDFLDDDEALQRAMELPMARTGTDIVEELEAASMGLIFESVVGKAVKKIEFATLKDNGGVERGYCAVLCQEALTVGKQERPREQFANLQGSRFAWVDNFAPNQRLCSAVLRQISGGNTLTAARKGRGENIFSFHGDLLLCTNGVWQADAEFFGSDRRRITGVKFEHNFVDNPTRPHKLLKDNSVKQNIPEMFAEFWWVARVFWLAPHPGEADITERTAQSTAQPSSMPEASELVRRYLQPYVLSETRPATSQEVDSYIADQLCVSPTAVRDELKKILMRREGEVIPRFGARTRTSARVYVRPSPRQIMTLVVSA